MKSHSMERQVKRLIPDPLFEDKQETTRHKKSRDSFTANTMASYTVSEVLDWPIALKRLVSSDAVKCGGCLMACHFSTFTFVIVQ